MRQSRGGSDSGKDNQQRRLQQAPFKLSTELRGRERENNGRAPALEKSKTFKAKPMPNYKFFEATKGTTK